MTRIDTKVSLQHASRAHNIVLRAITGDEHHVRHREVWEQQEGDTGAVRPSACRVRRGQGATAANEGRSRECARHGTLHTFFFSLLSHVSPKDKDPRYRRLPLPIRRPRNCSPRRRACLYDLRTRPGLAILQRRIPLRRAHPPRVTVGSNKHLGSLTRDPFGGMRLHVFPLQEAQDPAHPNCAYFLLPWAFLDVLTSIYRLCIS